MMLTHQGFSKKIMDLRLKRNLVDYGTKFERKKQQNLDLNEEIR